MKYENALFQKGFTIIEIVVSIALFSMGMLVVLGSLNTATSQSKSGISRVMAADSSSTLGPRLMEMLSESSILHIDTAARVTLVDDGIIFQSDRFNSLSMNQCPSATCGFHTRADLTTIESKLICGHEHRDGMGFGGVTRGKNFPSDITECPYDGNLLQQSCSLDGVKMLAARSNGQFATRDGKPHWNTMLFIFPRANADGFCDLTVTELRISDLFDSGVIESTWTRWQADDVDFVDLLDFGTDGTTDGAPDGSAPVSVAGCDSNYERFVMLSGGNVQNVIFEKTLGAVGDPIYRRVDIEIDLTTGKIAFRFEHHESIGVSWQSSGTITRPPRILTSRLTEFAVSTEQSSPEDAVNNPLGLDSSVVRVHVGTTHRKVVSQVTSFDHQVQTIRVFPKN